MKITTETLSLLEQETGFVRVFSTYAEDVLHEAGLFPKLSESRLIDAHGAWQNDLSRVGGHEPNLEDGLDHFKRAGHLSFWLRRMSPVVEAAELSKNIADAEGYALTPDQRAFQELLFGYCNEYLAFDFGYQLCRFYEVAKPGGSARANNLTPSEDYYRTMCHFLKYKTVSPHAMFLIYKSLFLP